MNIDKFSNKELSLMMGIIDQEHAWISKQQTDYIRSILKNREQYEGLNSSGNTFPCKVKALIELPLRKIPTTIYKATTWERAVLRHRLTLGK
jgi:hypothetical protein